MTAVPPPVRVRFAPSPTGNLHIGSVRTALFNWLFARHHQGTFILRIEDTDLERSKPEYEVNILEGMKWLGLDWDEGPEVGGAFAPYRQTERINAGLYQPYAERLIQAGKAYYCYCTKEELDAERAQAELEKRPPGYSGRCLKLSAEEVKAFEREGRPKAIRFKVPNQPLVVHDLVRGDVTFDTSILTDMVIIKADGSPAYNFAVVIDDVMMQITHVIRGEDHLPNTPKQILIYEALGYPLPKFAHISMILGPDRSKLSKRHGATAVIDYQSQGFLPSVMLNFLALLGWSHPEEKEIMPLQEIVEHFDLDRIKKSAAIFDTTKLAWMNGQYLRAMTETELLEVAKPQWLAKGWLEYGYSETKMQVIIKSIHDNINSVNDLSTYADFYFEDPPQYDKEQLDKLVNEEGKQVLSKFITLIDGHEDAISETAGTVLMDQLCAELGFKKKQVYQPMRYAIIARPHGPSMGAVMEVLGLSICRARVLALLQ